MSHYSRAMATARLQRLKHPLNSFLSTTPIEYFSSRCFSAISTRRKPNLVTIDASGARLVRATERILRTPVGDLSPGMIRESDWCMEQWAVNRGGERWAKKLLNRIHYEEEETKKNLVVPSMMSSVVLAHVKGGGKRSAERAQLVLDEMKSWNTIVVSAVMDAWCKRGEAERAEALLCKMESGKMDMKPNTVSYTTVIDAWAKRGNAERAEGILNRMRGCQPNAYSYNSVINAYSKSKDPRAGEKATMLLNQMVSMKKVEPDAYSYASAINAWSNSKGGAAHAEILLHQMIERSQANHCNAKPNTIVFNSLLKVWSRSSQHALAADRAERLLLKMNELHLAGNATVMPNTLTFNTVLSTLAKCGEKGDTAKLILDKMETLYKEGNASLRPDTFTYNSVINAYARTKGHHAAQMAHSILKDMSARCQATGIKPDTVTCNTVIRAFSNTHNPHKAEEILLWMEQRGMKPDNFSYNSVIDAFAKTGNPEKAEALLSKMELAQILPDTISYSTVINSWARSRHRNAGQKAEFVLKRMEHLYTMGNANLRASTITINSVLNAHARSKHANSAKRAEQLLQKSILQQMRKTNKLFKTFLPSPDMISFCSVINAYAYSPHPEKAEKAARLLSNAKEFYATIGEKPNPQILLNAHHMTIKACSYALVDKRRALYVALDVVKEMQVPPKSLTYKEILNACALLLEAGKERDELSLGLFQMCCRDGLVDKTVLSKFLQLLESPEISQELGCEVVGCEVEDLPLSWTSNVS